ncbi:MAG: hypothetical protein ACE5HE_00600, partial [Phycisphaerae bacterium]
LSGWGRDNSVLIVGDFAAIENRRAGEQILEATEKDGMRRAEARPRPSPVHGPPRKARTTTP